jgi:AraC-like DNA-binding protein
MHCDEDLSERDGMNSSPIPDSGERQAAGGDPVAGLQPQPSPKGGLSVRAAVILKEFLEQNFTRPLSVAEMADVCGLSPRYFIRSFTKTFGDPPHRHIIKRRLAFAEDLLLEGHLTIAEVSHLSGFSSQSHLTSLMTKYRGVTPLQLRAER